MADEAIDPSSLDELTRRRLEDLLEKHVGEDARKGYYDFFNPEKAKEAKRKDLEPKLQKAIKSYKKNKRLFLGHGPEDNVGLYLQEGERLGVDETLLHQFADIVYNYNNRKIVLGGGYVRVSEVDRLLAAEILGKSKKEKLRIKEKMLFSVIMGYGDSSQATIDEYTRDFPPKTIRKVAEKAYQQQMKFDTMPNTYRAALIAKHYNLADKYDAAIEKLRAGLKEPGQFSLLEGKECLDSKLEQLDLPQGVLRSWMLMMFEHELPFKAEEAKQLALKYEFTNDELRERVNRVDKDLVSQGWFGNVLGLREVYGHLIDDEHISTEDLKTLASIEAST